MNVVREMTAWRRRALVVVVAVCAPAVLHAQEIGVGAAHPFHAAGLSTGAATMSVDALNARLAAGRFAGLSNDAVTYGATGYYAVGRALLGASAHRSLFGEEGLANGRTDDLGVWQLLATASYAIVSTSRVTVYPSLGAGIARLQLQLRDSGTLPATTSSQFDDIVQAPGRSTRLDGHALLYDLGIGADYLVTRSAASAVGVVFGMRAGVTASPNRTTWSSAGRTVDAGPDGGPGGPYLRVVVGVGGR